MLLPVGKILNDLKSLPVKCIWIYIFSVQNVISHWRSPAWWQAQYPISYFVAFCVNAWCHVGDKLLPDLIMIQVTDPYIQGLNALTNYTLLLVKFVVLQLIWLSTHIIRWQIGSCKLRKTKCSVIIITIHCVPTVLGVPCYFCGFVLVQRPLWIWAPPMREEVTM